jgi:hypothetical protein
MDMTPTTCCSGCGLPASAERVAFTWALSIDPHGRRSWICTACARTALPVIESGVPAPLR